MSKQFFANLIVFSTGVAVSLFFAVGFFNMFSESIDSIYTGINTVSGLLFGMALLSISTVNMVFGVESKILWSVILVVSYLNVVLVAANSFIELYSIGTNVIIAFIGSLAKLLVGVILVYLLSKELRKYVRKN